MSNKNKNWKSFLLAGFGIGFCIAVLFFIVLIHNNFTLNDKVEYKSYDQNQEWVATVNDMSKLSNLLINHGYYVNCTQYEYEVLFHYANGFYSGQIFSDEASARAQTLESLKDINETGDETSALTSITFDERCVQYSYDKIKRESELKGVMYITIYAKEYYNESVNFTYRVVSNYTDDLKIVNFTNGVIYE